MELGGQKGELSCSTTQSQQEEESTGKNQLQVPTGKDVQGISYKKSTSPATRPETSSTLNSHFSPMDCDSKQPLPTTTFFSIK